MSKREEIAPHGDRRYVRDNAIGWIQASVEEGAALLADAHRKAKAAARPGQGARGDRHTEWSVGDERRA